MDWFFNHISEIATGMTMLVYVIQTQFVISYQHQAIQGLSKRLDSCEHEISELRKVIIDLVVKLSHGSTEEED